MKAISPSVRSVSFFPISNCFVLPLTYTYLLPVPSRTASRPPSRCLSHPSCSAYLSMTSQGVSTPALPARRDAAPVAACFTDLYAEQLKHKVTRLRQLLSWNPEHDHEITIFESPKSHYRMRASFQIWNDEPKKSKRTANTAYYAMFEPGNSRAPLEVKEFARGSLKINTLMKDLMKILKDSELLFQGLFEVRFVTTLSDQAIVLLCYHQPLSEAWKKEAEIASKELNATIIGRSKKVKIVVGGGGPDPEWILETLTIKEKKYYLYQTEGAFSQPNAKVCEQMISWVLDVTQNSYHSDLLELYCGGGTFTVVVAQNFRKVLATEISKASVKLGMETIKVNGIQNIQILRLSSEEFTKAYLGTQEFKRIQEAGVDLKTYDLKTVLVDPPRAGLDLDTCKLLMNFDKIVYVSCNPETLARDVEILKESHQLEKVAAFDQFPYTDHLESGVVMVKKSQPPKQTNASEVPPVEKKPRIEP